MNHSRWWMQKGSIFLATFKIEKSPSVEPPQTLVTQDKVTPEPDTSAEIIRTGEKEKEGEENESQPDTYPEFLTTLGVGIDDFATGLSMRLGQLLTSVVMTVMCLVMLPLVAVAYLFGTVTVTETPTHQNLVISLP